MRTSWAGWLDRRAERLPPWKVGISGRIIEAETRKTDTPDVQRGAALAALRTTGEQDYMLYTDGSARGGVEDGGASVAVYRGDVLVHSWSGPAVALCSSYTAGATAMRKAVEWLEGREGWSRALVATDSKALVAALDGRGGGPSAGRICDVLCRMSENGRVVRHPRLVQVYRGGINEGEEESLTRREKVDLSRIRTGHHPALRRWLAMVGREESPECRLCGAGEESAEHLWLRCDALAELRRRHQLGSEMAELVEQPAAASAMLGAVFSRLR